MDVLEAVRAMKPGECVVVSDQMFFDRAFVVAKWRLESPKPDAWMYEVVSGKDVPLPRIDLWNNAKIERMPE